MASAKSPFYVPVDLERTALLMSDVQTQILARFPTEVQRTYLDTVKQLLDFFRQSGDKNHAPPLIIHHVLPFGINQNGFVSPYNKLASWVESLEAKGFFDNAGKRDPNHPNYAIPAELVPPNGWGYKDEIILSKLTPGSFGSSELQQYLRARDIKHIVLVGLTTMGSILGGARQGADLDFHIIIPREGVMDDDAEVNDFLLNKVLPKFVDVVNVDDVLALER